MEGGIPFANLFLGVKKGKNLLRLAMVLWLTAVSGQEVEEPPPVITTENFEFPTFETTEKPTEAPNDNGMAIKVIPEQLKPDPPSAVEGKEEEALAVEEQPVVVAFPENHKNFTPSQYLGEQEFPPYYNHLNSYQQQYKNYYEQKQIYSKKPVKFEENSLKNFYLPTGADSPVLGEEKEKEDFRVNRNPFPYAFEKERGQELSNWYKNTDQEQNNWYKNTDQEQSNWYKNTGPAGVQEQPANDHVYRGQHENNSPYYVYPYSYPQKVKFYEEQLLHYDDSHRYHHQLKKTDKESAWKKVFNIFTALLPLGLLLATLTPNVIAINSTATSKTTRQRSEDSPPLRFKEEDVLLLMKKYGVDSLSEMQCEDRVICELAREGGKSTAGPIEKGFWFLANQTPWDVAEKAGMNELFKAIKTGTCEAYKCHSKNKRVSKGSFGKKLIRKHKIPE